MREAFSCRPSALAAGVGGGPASAEPALPASPMLLPKILSFYSHFFSISSYPYSFLFYKEWPYVHGKIDRSEAEKRLKGCEKIGCFLVRAAEHWMFKSLPPLPLCSTLSFILMLSHSSTISHHLSQSVSATDPERFLFIDADTNPMHVAGDLGWRCCTSFVAQFGRGGAQPTNLLFSASKQYHSSPCGSVVPFRVYLNGTPIFIW